MAAPGVRALQGTVHPCDLLSGSGTGAAKWQAADIATAKGTPLYRGLAYAQQSAQVTKASASAATAASGAIQTIISLRVAMRTGVGIREAYAALRVTGVEAGTVARLDRELAEDLLTSYAADGVVVTAGKGPLQVDDSLLTAAVGYMKSLRA